MDSERIRKSRWARCAAYMSPRNYESPDTQDDFLGRLAELDVSYTGKPRTGYRAKMLARMAETMRHRGPLPATMVVASTPIYSPRVWDAEDERAYARLCRERDAYYAVDQRKD